MTGSEDCLYLNVFTRPRQTLLRPVFVWIHGGSFSSGSGDDTWYNPDRAMDQDWVVVTINFRLGILGFLASSDGVIPGR